MEPKPVRWIGSSLRDLCGMPEEVKDEVGSALQKAQYGNRARNTAILQGFGGASVIEVKADDDDGATYRVVYTVRHPNYIYVLHAFQKKSRHGIETPKAELELVGARLKAAEEDYKALQQGTGR